MTKRKTGDHPDLKMVNPNAAAIDIGSTMHVAAVNPDACDMPVRAFGTFTQDLHDLAAWFPLPAAARLRRRVSKATASRNRASSPSLRYFRATSRS
jgi:hypothetical protein